MILTPTKATITQAVKRVFDAGHPDPRFQNLLVSLEHPEAYQRFPAIWVDFSLAASVRDAGIAHYERDDSGKRLSRWLFNGDAVLTPVAKSSREHDDLFDAVLKMIAHGELHEHTKAFVDTLTSGTLVALSPGLSEARTSTGLPPTRMNDEWVYESTVSIPLMGEAVSDPETGELVVISAVDIIALREGETYGEDDGMGEWKL